ncbi:MAG: 2-C-methyl-D-erythritol 2,4-cyclodiphosphate synthase [bacterium]
MTHRIGIGQDSHKFIDNKPLFLGGVNIPDHPGLFGNSDGDAVLHALCNAISSAMGKGSIGTYADKLCSENKITDSKEYLKTIFKTLQENSFKINNISISVEAKTPKIEPYSDAMKNVIAEILKIEKNQIGITATTGEGLTAFGRGEGVAVIATAVILNDFDRELKR